MSAATAGPSATGIIIANIPYPHPHWARLSIASTIFPREPSIDDERRGQHGRGKPTPFQRSEISNDNIVRQVKTRATDRHKYLANDICRDTLACSRNDISENVEQQREEVCVGTGGDIGDLGDEGFADGGDDTGCNGKGWEDGAVLLEVGGGIY